VDSFKSIEFHFLIVFYKSGIGDPSPTGWWGFSGCWFFNTEMDPNWSKIKRILRRHEEISQANSSALQLISIKLGEMDQAMVSLRNLLEIQTKQINEMELDIQKIKSLVLPQHSASTSINQGAVVSPREGNTVNDIEHLHPLSFLF
jgi:hypothetical protein